MTNSEKPDPGIFIVKGDTVGVNELTITVADDGKIQVSPVVLKTAVDMTPFWLDIAYQHVKATERHHKSLMKAKNANDDEKISEFLKKESSSGMLAVVSSGIAIDAYYASVKNCITISASQTKIWRDTRTARYKQISEVFRLGFPLNNRTFNQARSILKQNLTLRDKAVHPSSGTTLPAVHVELNKVTDWRYATFRFYNVKAIYGSTLSVVYKTSAIQPVKKHKKLQQYCSGLVPKLTPLVRRWKRKYGPLL